MDTIFEVLKITLPAAIVYFTVHSLWKSYLSAQLQMEHQKNNAITSRDKAQLKVQALERLLMFCERANPYQLRMRLSTPDLNGKALAMSMIMAIQQEFEHNISQQLYVSETLWKILTTAKNQMVEIIAGAAESISSQSDQAELFNAMDQVFEKTGILPLDKAKTAIIGEYNGA